MIADNGRVPATAIYDAQLGFKFTHLSYQCSRKPFGTWHGVHLLFCGHE
ncbi:hypothetical protein [Plantibacter sp. MMLR14_011]|nr:hypothetical protein [Plantibacter sp. MMLR14_011]